MGCVNSRADINDHHPNIFQVMNVDDLGNLITPGQLKITESDIVLYQRGKPPVKWPLRCLRRYGYDSEIFSFESGRRCSTGPGIYAFKCRRADQLFNLVQTNIQVCNGSGDDTVSRDLSVTPHTVPTLTRVTISPIEANCLEPLPTRTNSRATSRFSHSQQNGISRLASVTSSSGPMSPQGTMGSPSPPPMIMSGAPMGPPPPPPQPQPPPQPISASASSVRHHPSAVYVNEQILSAFVMEMELDNNNKSLRRTIQRSQTVSSTSSSGLLSEPSSGMALLNQDMMKLGTASATYINVDLSNEPSPLSPTHSASNAGQLPRDDAKEGSRHAYMNVSPGQEPVSAEIFGKTRPIALPQLLTLQQQQQQQLSPGTERDEGSRHCYANLEPAEIEGLRVRFSGGGSVASGTEKSPPPPPPPLPLPFPSPAQNQLSLTPPLSEPIREVNYAVLDLDKNNASSLLSSSTPPEPPPANALPSPPDSPNKPQKGYATIDFNKTAALSHSVNPNVVNDNEGSRKTRHNSTINDLTAPSRHSSSISE